MPRQMGLELGKNVRGVLDILVVSSGTNKWRLRHGRCGYCGLPREYLPITECKACIELRHQMEARREMMLGFLTAEQWITEEVDHQVGSHIGSE